jgi:hypothetical protein
VRFTKGAGVRSKTPALTIGSLIAVAAMLVFASAAMGGADPLKGGTTTLNLQSLKVSKASGGATKAGKKSATLPITGGSLDPTNGTGPVENGGSVKVKKGKKSATLSEIKTTFGSGLSAKLKGKTTQLATLTGGTVGRAGFGGTVTGATAKLTKKGAKALNKALGTSSFKKGKKLGSADTSTVPKTVEVVSGVQTAHGDVGFGKLATTYVSPTMGPCPNAAGSPANEACYGKGVSPVPGAGVTATDGASYTVPGGPITAPINPGSSIAPDASAGTVKAAGTTVIKKTVSAALYSGTCPEDPAHFPIGNLIQFSNTTNDFTNKVVNVDLTLQAPVVAPAFSTPTFFGSQIPSGGIDMSTATVSNNPGAKTVDITGYKVFNQVATQANLINGTFGFDNTTTLDCGSPLTNAAVGDALFNVDMHLTTH